MDRRRVMTDAQWFSAVTPGREHHGARFFGIVLGVIGVVVFAIVMVLHV